ncbi:MAG: hypothetical protein K5868_05230 [Lachnospiraceae bacterium]|nr:hypothetical protein [Lachnospiraceae bacterium]
MLFSRRIPNRIILTIYLSFVLIAFLDVFVTEDIMILIVTTVSFAIVVFFLSDFLLEYISGIKILDNMASNLSNKTIIIISFLGTFLCMMLWFAGFFPGSFQGDCIAQMKQALTGDYSDWHPVWHTVLIYTIPLKLTGGRIWSVVFFQIIWFCVAISYMCVTIHYIAGIKWTIIAWAYIILNPYTGQMMLYPWKDSAFAITALVSMIMVIRIVYSQGVWTDKWFNCLMLGFMLTNTTLFRHNAVLFTLPLIMALFFNTHMKQWIKVVVYFLITLIIIKIPMYEVLDVYREPQSVEQAVGLPMSVIANVAKETPELLDEETSGFIYSIAPQETWENDYVLGNYGVVKYYSDINNKVIEETGVLPIFKMGLRCFTYSPKASFKAFFSLTDIVYGIDILDEGHIGTQIETNDLGIHNNGNIYIAELLDIYYKIVRLHGLNFCRQFSFSLLLILVFALAVFKLNVWNDWKKLFLIIPAFTYAYGTMFLLTSPDSRFFYMVYLICPISILLILTHRRNDNEELY